MNDGPQEESGMHTEKALTGCMQMNRLERKSHGRHLQTSGDDGINLTNGKKKKKDREGKIMAVRQVEVALGRGFNMLCPILTARRLVRTSWAWMHRSRKQ